MVSRTGFSSLVTIPSRKRWPYRKKCEVKSRRTTVEARVSLGITWAALALFTPWHLTLVSLSGTAKLNRKGGTNHGNQEHGVRPPDLRFPRGPMFGRGWRCGH